MRGRGLHEPSATSEFKTGSFRHGTEKSNGKRRRKVGRGRGSVYNNGGEEYAAAP